MAAEAWEARTARLEGAYEQVDRRLGTVESRLASLERKVDDGFAALRAEIRAAHAELRAELGSAIRELRGETHRQFYWLLGVLLVSVLLPLGLKFAGR